LPEVSVSLGRRRNRTCSSRHGRASPNGGATPCPPPPGLADAFKVKPLNPIAVAATQFAKGLYSPGLFIRQDSFIAQGSLLITG
jgi:hypothetical protein